MPKIIPVIETDKLHECVYLENYRFYQCPLKSCKNWSDQVPTHCLGIDRTNPLGNKHISDSEILVYKMKNENVQLRMVSLRRKEAVDSIKCMFILDKFLDWVRASSKKQAGFIPTKPMQECQKRYPLKVKLLKFESWMWFYMTEDVYAEFTKCIGGETGDYTMKDILNLTAPQYKHVYNEEQQSVPA